MDVDYGLLKKSLLFGEMTDGEIDKALELFNAELRRYPKGSSVKQIDEKMTSFGMVISGIVHIFTYDHNGNEMMMASVEKLNSFGETLCFLGLPTNVYISAAENAEILWLSGSVLHAKEPDRYSPILAERFTRLLAHKILEMNSRIQVLSQVSLRGKLTTFLLQCAASYRSNVFSLPFGREKMAVYLGTNRSALSRELSSMSREGIISFSRNTFTICDMKKMQVPFA